MLVLAIYGNLIPFRFESRSLSDAATRFRQIDLLDASSLEARGDWVVSGALFTALSFLLMAAICLDRPASLCGIVALPVFLFCAALSVVVEFVQFFFPPRTVSLNDIIIEILGGLAGTLVWLIVGQQMTYHMRKLTGEPRIAGLAARLLPCYFALLLIVELMPFDVIVSKRELAEKFEEGKIWLVPFQYVPVGGPMAWLGKAVKNLLCFAPAGFLFVLARDLSTRLQVPWWKILAFALGIPSLVQLLKLFVYSRFCDATDLVMGALAVLAGWSAGLAFALSLQRGPSNQGYLGARPANWRAVLPLLLAAWAAAVIYFNWRPFNFTTDAAHFVSDLEDLPQHGLRRFSWLPLVEYYWSNKYEVLDQFIQKSAAFVFFGMLISLMLHPYYKPASAFPAVLAALAIGTVLQIGRYYLPLRVPSVTDVGLACVGAWFGFRLTQHLRAILWAEQTLFGSYGYLHVKPR